MAAIITKTDTKTWYLASIPMPTARPASVSVLLVFLFSQVKKANIASVKKKISMVSSMVILESQKNPGITPSRTLDSSAVFWSYVRLVNSYVIQIESRENVTAVSLPEVAFTPKTWKNTVVTPS